MYTSLLTSYAGNFATRREELSSTIHPIDTCDKHAKSSGISTDVAALVMFVARLRENAEQVPAPRTAWESQRPSGRRRIGYGTQQRISIHMSETKVIEHLLFLRNMNNSHLRTMNWPRTVRLHWLIYVCAMISAHT